MRTCRVCGLEKPIDNFRIRKASTGLRRTECSDCLNAYCKRYRKVRYEPQRVERAGRKKARIDSPIKTCVLCRRDLPKSQFWGAETCVDKLSPYCNECDVAKVRRWRHRNPERARQHTRKYAVKSKEVIKDCIRNYHVRKRGAAGEFTSEEFREVARRYGNICLACGASGHEKKLVADHVLPLSKGGSNYISNIQPLCGPCNSRKRDKYIDYRKLYVTNTSYGYDVSTVKSTCGQAREVSNARIARRASEAVRAYHSARSQPRASVRGRSVRL